MKRLVLAALIAPLPWPWISAAVAMLVFRTITGIDAHYYFWTTPLSNLHMFVEAYVLMLFCLPLLVLLLRRQIRNLRPYALLGLGVGIFATVLFLVLPPFLLSEQPLERAHYYGLLRSYPHRLAGNAIATGVMVVTFWYVAVRLNSGS